MRDPHEHLKDIFAWSSRFETGLRDIDHQHATLVRMINSLSQLVMEGTTRGDLSVQLDELDSYASYHFRTEEDLMAQYSLDAGFIASHIRAHQSLSEQIRIVRNLAEGAELSISVGGLLPFLTKWLLFHVLGTDMQMVLQIKAQSKGITPSEAREQTARHQSDSLVIVLDALSEITDNLTLRTTQLQEANHRLRISEARYAMAQRAAHIGSWEFDLETQDISWSDEVEALYGFRLHDFGRPLDGLMACTHPDDRHLLEHALTAVLRGGTSLSLMHRVVWADGSIRWLAVTGERMGDNGDGNHLVGIVRDVTEEKLAREQLQDSNAQLKLSLASVERHAADLTTLNDLNEGLQSCLNAAEAFDVVEHTLSRLNLGSGGALAVQQAGSSPTLRVVARWGDGGGLAAQFETNACWGMRRGQRHIVHHAGDGPLCKHFEREPASPYVCHPLQVLGETLGLLCVRADPEISESDWERLNHLAMMVAESLKLALSNVRLREALHDQAIRDPLTGLLNRRYLDETLPREIVRAQRERRPLSLAVLDLDHFKQVNDTWGHEAGDAVLAHLALMLRTHLRSSDLACRFGGEEFVVVMLGATLTEARERIHQIGDRVRASPVQCGQSVLPTVTFSAGLAQAGLHGESADDLLRAADRALYVAKEEGRNCIREAPPVPPTSVLA